MGGHATSLPVAGPGSFCQQSLNALLLRWTQFAQKASTVTHRLDRPKRSGARWWFLAIAVVVVAGLTLWLLPVPILLVKSVFLAPLDVSSALFAVAFVLAVILLVAGAWRTFARRASRMIAVIGCVAVALVSPIAVLGQSIDRPTLTLLSTAATPCDVVAVERQYLFQGYGTVMVRRDTEWFLHEVASYSSDDYPFPARNARFSLTHAGGHATLFFDVTQQQQGQVWPNSFTFTC